MVVDQQRRHADRLFHAFADGTRRDIVCRAMRGEHSVSFLARSYPISLAAVQKHVTVLERAGLVITERRGRERIVRTDIGAIRATQRLLDQMETVWRGRVERLGGVLSETTEVDERCP